MFAGRQRRGGSPCCVEGEVLDSVERLRVQGRGCGRRFVVVAAENWLPVARDKGRWELVIIRALGKNLPKPD